MAPITLTIDPAGTAFALHNGTSRKLLGFDAPVPDTDSQWASSADTEGERRANLRYRNRVITARVQLRQATDLLLQADENLFGQKVGKLAREGGQLQFGYPSGTQITFTVLEASFRRVFENAHIRAKLAEYEVAFVCEPFGLGTEEDLGDNVETTLPVLVFTEATVKGDVPALGRLVIDNDATVDQSWLTWGIQSRHYSAASTAALFYQAEDLTPLGGSATAAGSGSPSGTVMQNNDLFTNYQAILSTQATGGGAHLTHVGTYRVYARVWKLVSSLGTLTVAFEWAQGDFLRTTMNRPFQIPDALGAVWYLADLGLVTIRPTLQGSQRWEGRLMAKSTLSGDNIAVDYLMLVPVDEGSGIATASSTPVSPSSFNAVDEFTATTAGNALNTRVAPTGGTWATSGDATDLTFSDTLGESLVRSTTSDTNGRFGILGSTNYTNVQVDGKIARTGLPTGTSETNLGLIARWTDSSNYLRATVEIAISGGLLITTLKVEQVVTGTVTTLASDSFPGPWLADAPTSGTYYPLSLVAFASGNFAATLRDPTTNTVLSSATGNTTVLATGGTLATGKPGIWDQNTSAGAVSRYYDDFFVSTPVPDAVIFGSQSMELRYNGVAREDQTGAVWGPVTSYVGDYLLVPPSGAEGRTARMIVKASRPANPETSADSTIDDISARLFVTPRYLVVPSA